MTVPGVPQSFTRNFCLRDLLQLVVIIGLGVGFLLKTSGTSTAQTVQITELTEIGKQLQADMRLIRDREGRVDVLQKQVDSNEQRVKRAEDAIYGPGGLNEKYTDIQSKLTVIANLLEGRKK